MELLSYKLQLLPCSPRGHIKKPFSLVSEVLGLSCAVISDLPAGGTVSITLGSQLFSPILSPVAWPPSCDAEDRNCDSFNKMFLGQCLHTRSERSQNGLGWKGSQKSPASIQPSCHGQGRLLLDRVSQSLIQPGFFQGWGVHNFSGQPVPASQHPHCKEFLPSILSKPATFILSN